MTMKAEEKSNYLYLLQVVSTDRMNNALVVLKRL